METCGDYSRRFPDGPHLKSASSFCPSRWSCYFLLLKTKQECVVVQLRTNSETFRLELCTSSPTLGQWWIVFSAPPSEERVLWIPEYWFLSQSCCLTTFITVQSFVCNGIVLIKDFFLFCFHKIHLIPFHLQFWTFYYLGCTPERVPNNILLLSFLPPPFMKFLLNFFSINNYTEQSVVVFFCFVWKIPYVTIVS